MHDKNDLELRLKQNLKTKVIARELHCLDITTSTMDIARKLALDGTPAGTAVISLKQESGRGRMGRSWLSPEGSLATSIILYPLSTQIHLMPAIAAVAVFRSLAKIGIKATIKWPNDILIGGKKVCGILIENGFKMNDTAYSVVGIGLNVNFNTTQHPEIAEIATSVSMHLGKDLPVEEAALNLYTELDELYVRIDEENLIHDEWISNMETLGKRISVNMGGSLFEGICETINSKGNLVLRTDDGLLHEIIAGDVINVRNKPD